MEELLPLIPSEMKPPMNPVLITDVAGLQRVRDFLARVTEFGFDYETNVVNDFHERRIRTAQIGNKDEQYVIDLLAFAGDEQTLIAAQGEFGKVMEGNNPLQPVIDLLREVLESEAYLKLGQNLAFEYNCSKWCLGIRMTHVYSVDIAEKLLYAGLINFMESGFWALDDMVARYCKRLLNKELQKSFDLKTPLTHEQVVYAALDTRLPFAIRAGQKDRIKAEGLEHTVELENNAIGSFTDMELNGLLCNSKKWGELHNSTKEKHVENVKKLDEFFIPIVGSKKRSTQDLNWLEANWREYGVASVEEKLAKGDEKKRLREERTKLRDKAREEFYAARKEISLINKNWDTYEGEAAINYASKAQVRDALRKVPGINAKNLPDTNDKTLSKLADEFPIIGTLQEYRTTEKAIDNYGEAWITPKDAGGHVHPKTGRIHARMNQLGAATGRTSSSNPNLQNIPKDDRYRACFTARPGYKIITVDMSGAELRIIADDAKAKTWIDAFNNKWDVHSVSTEILYFDEWQKERLDDCAYFTNNKQKCKCPKHKDRRDDCKSTNFLLAYGGGPSGLADAIGKPVNVCKELMALHRSKFPDIWDYLEASGKKAVRTLESRTMGGRRRAFKRPVWADAAVKATEKLKRLPTTKEISKQLASMFASIEREGKNHRIQGTNADMIKLAMGAGYDKNGKPFLWHILEPVFGAFLINMVHDELVVECPEEHVEECRAAIADALTRAGAVYLKYVIMETDSKVSDRWMK